MSPRVLFINQTAKLGGGEHSLFAIARAVGDAGSTLLLEDGALSERLRKAGLVTWVLNAPAPLLKVRRDRRPVSPLMPWAVAHTAWRVRRMAGPFDVAYANSQKAFILAALARLLGGPPVIWHLRDLLTPEHFGALQIRVAVALGNRFAARVLVNSNATEAAWIAAGGRSDRVKVVHSGVDPARFDAVTAGTADAIRRERGIGDAPLLGVFGRFHPWKGQHVAVEAVARLPDVHVLFVGDALFGEQDYVAEVRARAVALGIERRAHFLGFRDDIPTLMRAVDIVLHTSARPEPFGRVIVEGMMAQRPVIATRGGGAEEIVEDEVSGLLVPPGDSTALAAAAARLLGDVPFARRLAEAGSRRARARFSEQAMVQAVRREIEAVAAAAHVAPRAATAHHP